MAKKIRNAVRVFILKEEKVVCIKYKEGPVGYLDIPGGKIEDGENPEQAAIREVKEETGMDIKNLEKIGIVNIEYPDRIYHFQVFIAINFLGSPQEFQENTSFWIPISNLSKESKKFGITYLLEKEYEEDFKKKQLNVIITSAANNDIISIERM